MPYPPDAYGLPTALGADASLDYQSAAFGKWHLANEENGGLQHPNLVGFDHYEGNFNGGAVESYFAWSKVINGESTEGQTGYVTTETVNDVLNWYDQRDPARPWLIWVAFNAPHSPYAPPPAELVSEETTAEMAEGGNLSIYHAMIEAMDTEIGRLLSEIPAEDLANTYVVFLGDNGTPTPMATAPFTSDRVKGKVHQGGINVPFIVAGPNVPEGATTSALANSVDLYSTVLDLAGTAADSRLANITLDGVSLASVFENPESSVRNFAYADVFGPQQGRIANRHAIRGVRYKLIRDLRTDVQEFYDLSVDPYEQTNLLDRELLAEERQAYDDLLEKLETLRASL
jgi:arylsulfatase A-like enzyme